jgi:predicted kinase
MNYLIILCGYSFSGKSTLASKLVKSLVDASIISLDQINKLLGFDISGEISLKEWENTHKIVCDKIETNKKNFLIIDDTNMFKKHRDRFINSGDKAGRKSLIIFVDTSQKEVRNRYAKIKDERHLPPLAAFNYVIENFEKPKSDENFIVYSTNTDYKEFLENLLKQLT